MAFEAAGFQWDRGNRNKCQTHGISIREIEGVFRRPIAVFPDPAHSLAEERFKAIGTTTKGRHVLIVFTLRQRRTNLHSPDQCPVHAREEIDHYEKAAADTAVR